MKESKKCTVTTNVSDTDKYIPVSIDNGDTDKFFECKHGYIYSIPEHNVYLKKCKVNDECCCIDCQNFEK